MNGEYEIEEILTEQSTEYDYSCEEWPDSVHHQDWHDSWRNSH